MKSPTLEQLIFLSFLTHHNVPKIHALLGLMSKQGGLFIFELPDFSKEVVDNCLEKARHSIAMMEANGVEAIPYYSNRYPAALQLIDDFPPVLYVKGSTNWKPNLAAVVGPRDCSASADEKTVLVTRALIEQGFGIVSGLALGVDTIAHEVAVDQGAYTLAVLPGPLDSIYPPQNKELSARILDHGGTLVSELPFGLPLTKHRFLERNRLTTAFSNVVLPIEWREKGGTYKTIKHALKQGKTLLLPQFPTEASAENAIQKLEQQQQRRSMGQLMIARTMEELKEQLSQLFGK